MAPLALQLRNGGDILIRIHDRPNNHVSPHVCTVYLTLIAHFFLFFFFDLFFDLFLSVFLSYKKAWLEYVCRACRIQYDEIGIALSTLLTASRCS